MQKNGLKSLIALSLLGASVAAQANLLTYTGTLQNAQDFVRFDFNVSSQSSVNITTFSYAGGVMQGGTSVAEGGFDPDIILYNATTGAFIEYDDDGRGVPNSGGIDFDSYISRLLNAGDYSLFLGVFSTIYGPNINDPRSSTALDFGYTWDSQNNLVNLTGNYAIQFNAFDNVLTGGNPVLIPNAATAVPEPETYAMFMAGLGLMGFVARRRKV